MVPSESAEDDASAGHGTVVRRRSSLADVTTMVALKHCNRQLLKSVVRAPEEVQQHAAGMLIQSVFRGKHARKEAEAQQAEAQIDKNENSQDPDNPQLTIYSIAQAQRKTAHLAINAQIQVARKHTRSMENAQTKAGYFQKMMDDMGIPLENRAHRGILGVLIPGFVPRLEYLYQIAEMQRSIGSRQYAMFLGSLMSTVILVGIFMGLSDFKTGIPRWFIFNIIFLGLVFAWLCIFFQQKIGNRKAALLQNVAAVTVTFVVLWQSLDGESSSSEGSCIAMTTLVRILLALMGWAAIPQPKHLLSMLVIYVCAPFIWFLGCWLRSGADLSLATIEHLCYFLIFTMVLYFACRRSDLESRRGYLSSRNFQTTDYQNQKEIKKLQSAITEHREFFDDLFNKGRSQISALHHTLDNPEAKSKIQIA
jgi:hypothetical protein